MALGPCQKLNHIVGKHNTPEAAGLRPGLENVVHGLGNNLYNLVVDGRHSVCRIKTAGLDQNGKAEGTARDDDSHSGLYYWSTRTRFRMDSIQERPCEKR